MCCNQTANISYITILHKQKMDNSEDMIVAIDASSAPQHLLRSLYVSNKVPKHITTIYATIKIIGRMLVSIRTHYIYNIHNKIYIDLDRMCIQEIIENIYGRNHILF